MKLFGSLRELVATVFRKDAQSITLRPNQSTTYTADRDIQLPPGDAAHVLTSASSTQTLTNKTIDGDDNTVQDLALASLKTEAGDANKVVRRDGSGVVVSGNSLPNSSALVTTDATQTLTGKTIDGDDNTVQDLAITSIKTEAGDANKVFRRDGSGVPQSGNTIPNTSALVTSDSIQSLSNKSFSDALTLAEIATPSTPASGNGRIYFKADGSLYQLDDGGTEKRVGSGGAGGINYIAQNPNGTPGNHDAEGNTTTGWATYADAAASTPVDGTGGSPNVTIAAQSSNIIRGNHTFRLAKDAANRQGEGVSYAFKIDSADKSKVNYISIDVDTTSANYADNDVAVYIYDVDNATLITPSVTGVKRGTYKYQSSFLATTSDDYRLILHVSSTNASSYNFDFDNVSVGPQESVQGAPFETRDIASSITYSSGFGSVSTHTIMLTRIGDKAVIQGVFQNPSALASVAYIELPAGMNIDTSRHSTNTNRQLIGTWVKVRDATNEQVYSVSNNAGILYFDGTDTDRVYFATSSGASARQFTQVNVSSIATANSAINISIEVYIAEWAGSTVSLANTRVEYVANNGPTWDATNSSNFTTQVAGPAGVALGGALTANRIKRVRFQTPIQATDQISLEFSPDRRTWVRVGNLDGIGQPIPNYHYDTAGLTYFGAGFTYVSGSTTDIDVYFARYQDMEFDGGSPINWNSGGTHYWRVVKSTNPLSVGSQVNDGIEPTSMTDAQATRLGFKSYAHGTTYNGGNAPTITLNSGGGSLSSVGASSFIPYQTQSGGWRLRFNFTVTLSSTSRTQAIFEVAGITIAGGTTGHVFSGNHGTTAAMHFCLAEFNLVSKFQIQHASATTTVYLASGDIPLASKPTWAY